jgi:hypothetical protein
MVPVLIALPGEDQCVCMCKSVIALCCLYLNVITRECVTKVLINPIIRTRARHFRHVYHPTRDNRKRRQLHYEEHHNLYSSPDII